MKNFLLFTTVAEPTGIPIRYTADDLAPYDYLADFVAISNVGDFARASEGTYICVGMEFPIADPATDPEISQP